MSFVELKICTIDQLLLETRKLEDSENSIFRRVSDREHKLMPSIGRTRHSSVKKGALSAEEECRALRRFRDQVRPHVGLTMENDLEWLLLGQHHGLPTRLLDWTRSPLVAAHFAVKKIEGRVTLNGKNVVRQSSIDGVIYAVKAPPEVGPSDRETPFEITVVKMIDPPHISERITRQVGVLTIHPEPLTTWEPDGTLYVIPKNNKFDMKKELDRLGINEASLFPGVDATARYLQWQLKWNRLR